MLTPKRAAELLCVTAQTVKKYIYSGRLPSVTTPGGHHRIRESDVRALLKPSDFTSAAQAANPYLDLIRSLVRVIEELHDSFKPGHGERVAGHARALARRLGLPQEEQDQVWLGGLLHDVGKLHLDPRLLRKEGALTPGERDEIQQHPLYGSQLLGDIQGLEGAAVMVRHHHERQDGTGYPDGLAGEAIPLPAKIISLAEAYDSMCSQAPYRAALSPRQAVAEVLAGSGTFFDERLTADFVEMLH